MNDFIRWYILITSLPSKSVWPMHVTLHKIHRQWHIAYNYLSHVISIIILDLIGLWHQNTQECQRICWLNVFKQINMKLNYNNQFYFNWYAPFSSVYFGKILKYLSYVTIKKVWFCEISVTITSVYTVYMNHGGSEPRWEGWVEIREVC